MNSGNETERQNSVADLVEAAGFDTDNFSIVRLLCALLKQVVDSGTSIDTGGGRDSADLWAKIGGVEYYITVRKSNSQIAKDMA